MTSKEKGQDENLSIIDSSKLSMQTLHLFKKRCPKTKRKRGKMDVEKLRKSYMPDTIDILIVGESAPAGGTFFYDSSNMTIHTKSAFEQAFDRTFLDEKEFLNFFKNQNCYLDDICLVPIDNMANNQREQMLQDSVIDFSNRLKEYKPKVIIVALKKIDSYAKKAIEISGIEAEYYQIPFAGNGWQNKYIEELRKILTNHLR
jgi:hypothetical protein